MTAIEEKPKRKLDFSPGTKGVLWRVPLTAALICFFILGLFYAYVRSQMLWGFLDPYNLGLQNLLWAGAALGGSLGLRVFRLGWRHLVIASLLAGATLLLFGRLQPALVIPGDPFAMIMISGGIFLLPLFDPTVRRNRPAPSLWKMALAASILSFLIIRSTWLNSPFAILISLLLSLGMLLGLLLSLSTVEKNVADGARVGGLIILLQLSTMLILLLGR